MKVKELPTGKLAWRCPYCRKRLTAEKEGVLRSNASSHIRISTKDGHGKRHEYPDDWVLERCERIGYAGLSYEAEISHITEDCKVVIDIDLFGREERLEIDLKPFIAPDVEIETLERIDNELKVVRKNDTEIFIPIPTNLAYE